jgi:glycosyltransferase involved in cell wall biosynthesis
MSKLAQLPFFSIVLPTWNRENLIKDALKSLQEQTFSDFEVVIVDNHSVDNTRAVVESFNDNRFRYYYPENKLSQLECYTYGWNRCKGLYSASLDDDNVWRRNSLLKIKAIIDSLPEIELVCFDRGLIYHSNDHPNAQLRSSLRIHGFGGQCSLYSDSQDRIRSFCENIRFDQPYPGITNSFVKTDVLNRILNREEDIFPGKCIGGEEVVAVLLLNTISKFIYFDEPLCLFTDSGKTSSFELVSGNPNQDEFKDWYKGHLGLALENAPVKLPVYPNFSLFGLRHAQKLLNLNFEINWVEYYFRCEEWINLMHNWWLINPNPLLQIFERDFMKNHPHLVNNFKAGRKPSFVKQIKIPTQIVFGRDLKFNNIIGARDYLDALEPTSGWF